MTKNELITALRKFADDVKADDTMVFSDIDVLARHLTAARAVLSTSKRLHKERAPGPGSHIPKKGKTRKGTVERKLSTPEGREFWDGVEAGAREVESWPEWKKAW